MFKRIKRSINKFLQEIAEENKKEFGSGKLDCCNLNKVKTESRKN